MMSLCCKKYVSLLTVCLCTSVFFLGLFHFDNKYQYPGSQAANGILALSEHDLEKNPLRFLVSGWTYYPNALLTPDEIANGNHYTTYTSIGEHTQFSGASGTSPYGCGTYQMTFFLPKSSSPYALEIPEVFSCYTLYLNQECILEMGDPDTDTPLVQNRLITIDGGEPVTLTIAVSNDAHFYGGMVYPPAFGSMVAVNTMRGIRLVSALVGGTITLLCALLSFYLSWRMKQRHALLFGFISLGMCALISFPTLHMLVALPIFPWYALELCAIYLLIWLILLLQNKLCQPGRLPALISNTIGSLFCLLALGYGLLSSHLTTSLMALFSAAVFFYKVAFASYLLAIAIHAVYKKQVASRMIFYANLTAICALGWDRLLPNYEPIIGGWFIQWGIFFVVVAIGLSLWRNIVEGYSNSLSFEAERKQVQRQLAMQAEYNRQIATAVEDNRRLIHDIKHHLRTLDHIARTQDSTALRRLLNEVEAQVQTTAQHGHPLYCTNPAVNALIACYAGMARQQHTDFEVQLDFPNTLPLSDVEWCTIFGNLLDNAVETCALQNQGPKRILLTGSSHGKQFFLKIENTYDGTLLQNEHRLLSRKSPSPYHGIGLSSVQQIVSAHNGTLDILPTDNHFIVGITLPL